MNAGADLDGKNAFITGASSGLGRRFALTLARAGVRVAITGRRIERLEALAEEIESFDGRAMPIALDVTDTEAVHKAIAAAETDLGPLHILINNAGITLAKWLTEITEADYDRVMNTNVRAPFFVAQEVARRMIQHGHGGRIINIASVAAERPEKQISVYCTSKAAIAHLTRCMALEWARYGINVNAICPGWILTEINEDYFAGEAGQRLVQRFPRRRIGKPEDLDGVILLLASDASDFINGTTITVDDGQSLA